MADQKHTLREEDLNNISGGKVTVNDDGTVTITGDGDSGEFSGGFVLEGAADKKTIKEYKEYNII